MVNISLRKEAREVDRSSRDDMVARVRANIEANKPAWARCADQFVEQHHFCGGCPIGQFYCGIHDKWRHAHGQQ